MDLKKIRNFCIIAHIDHGKSTLADRMLEVTSTLSKREMKHDQMLDTMDLEQERGITIKLQPVRMAYKGHQLNLIDTPGHVDFTYEVSRSLAACETAILVVDASQGIQAQTIANVYLAIEQDLHIIPVINKIDLPNANVEKVTQELVQTLGIDPEEILHASAKEGVGVEEILDAILSKGLPPKGAKDASVKALIFDSMYDAFRGVIVYVRVFEGSIHPRKKMQMMGTRASFEALEVGSFVPALTKQPVLNTGEVGYVVTGLRNIADARVGDTMTLFTDPASEALQGYKKVKPMVFASIFCTDTDKFPALRTALEKLSLNDAALSFEPQKSSALGLGFHCGFLGLLHMEIVQERLEREFDLDLIVTAPCVSYQVTRTDGEVLMISNPASLPDRTEIEGIAEPWLRLEVVCPRDYTGNVMTLVQDKRGLFKNMNYLEDRVIMNFEIPLSEVILDFYDKLKSTTQGYASMNYELMDYRDDKFVKVDIMVAGDAVESLAQIILREQAESISRIILKALKKHIPKENFQIALQAAIGGKIIARESISAARKDVTAKLYGGDVTRKMKLLKKQKEGKKRLKQFGKVRIPQKAFMAVLKRES